MLMCHAFAGLPLTRTRTGRGRRQPALIAVAREGLTRMNGLPPRIFITAVKPVVMEISTHLVPPTEECERESEIPQPSSAGLPGSNGRHRMDQHYDIQDEAVANPQCKRHFEHDDCDDADSARQQVRQPESHHARE